MLIEYPYEPYQGNLPDLDIVKFFEDYINKEFSVALAAVSEEVDAEGFRQEVAKLDQYYSEGLHSGIKRFRQPKEPGFEEQKEMIHIKAPRTCFLIRGYQHDKFGRVYRFYTGTDRKKGKVYFHCYYIGKAEDRFQIMSVYMINERHTGWERKQGVNWAKENIIFEGVWRFEEPNHVTDQEDYYSERGIDDLGGSTLEGINLDRSDEHKATGQLSAPSELIILEDIRANAILRQVLPLLDGKFYVNGFIRNRKTDRLGVCSEENLQNALSFTRQLAELLETGGCTSLGSEGDTIYLPFVYCGDILLDGLPDFAANDDVPRGAKVIYDTIEDRKNCFWYDELEEDILENFAQGEQDSSFIAYVKADALMRKNLTELVEFHIEQGIEFPYVIGGTFAQGIFAGVVTSIVRTP
jgi:hypothetical protein